MFDMLGFGDKWEYDPEFVAGAFLMREDATPEDAWLAAADASCRIYFNVTLRAYLAVG